VAYLVGIDIGGTFTDCAIVDRKGRLLTAKVPSTPPDFSRGMMDALGTGARALGLSLDDFCRDIAFLSHGTTVGTNTIIQKAGAKVGLITTRGTRTRSTSCAARAATAGATSARSCISRRPRSRSRSCRSV
jgi:N-methylhydantoinase A